LAAGGSIQWRAAAADGEVLNAVDGGAGIVVIVPAEYDGDTILLSQWLDVSLDGGVVAAPPPPASSCGTINFHFW
jgi:hypothetical protein